MTAARPNYSRPWAPTQTRGQGVVGGVTAYDHQAFAPRIRRISITNHELAAVEQAAFEHYTGVLSRRTRLTTEDAPPPLELPEIRERTMDVRRQWAAHLDQHIEAHGGDPTAVPELELFSDGARRRMHEADARAQAKAFEAVRDLDVKRARQGLHESVPWYVGRNFGLMSDAEHKALPSSVREKAQARTEGRQLGGSAVKGPRIDALDITLEHE